MENTETTNTKTQTSLRLDATLFDLVSDIATAEDRSFTNMIERLLKTHPRIQPILEDAATGANA